MRSQNTIEKLVVDDKEITDLTHILIHIGILSSTFQKKQEHKTAIEIEMFFINVDIPKLFENHTKLCKEDLTEKDSYNSMKSMQNNKSLGNDELRKEFDEAFWNKMKEIFVGSVSKGKRGHLKISQRQAIIKLIEKTDRKKIHS